MDAYVYIQVAQIPVIRVTYRVLYVTPPEGEHIFLKQRLACIRV